jgi:leucyl/phenylalanyl-tRNA--protein transferase
MSSSESERDSFFPDPEAATAEGIVGFSLDFSSDLLIEAYSKGIFPWPLGEGLPIPWFCPEERGILEFENLRIPKRLGRELKKLSYQITIDQAFNRVIDACARAPRKDQDGTWITEELKEAYKDLHRKGVAHSVEAWEGSQLVGGLYGIEIKGVFSGESMFTLKKHASRCCLIYLIEYLEKHGAAWMDIQTLTPHMERMGAQSINRSIYLKKLERTQSQNLHLF